MMQYRYISNKYIFVGIASNSGIKNMFFSHLLETHTRSLVLLSLEALQYNQSLCEVSGESKKKVTTLGGLCSNKCATDIQRTEQNLRKMTSSSNLRKGSVWIDKLFETINQELKAQGTKYQVLPNFGTCCRELGALKATSIRACVRSFCSVY